MERLVSLPAPRTVFFVSDRTGITAEMLGNSLLSQFEGLNFQRRTIPFVDTPEKIDDVLRRIDETAAAEGRRPLVFSSIVDEIMSAQLGRANAMVLDLFQVFIAPLEAELAAKSSHAAGRSHGIANSHEYFARMEAINFTQAHDDGATTRELAKAQVILIGVSRCGKTPTALYLALQFGILTANFPLTPDDFVDKLFGLTIDPERLQQIRQARRPASQYASLANCQFEVREAASLMQREQVPAVDTTSRSIEEIATTILHRAGLQRHIY
jgi:[pyruvate, water dikinase]-phosphate phosphotransferase / [pyruvate, water dikinase] kinase